MSTLQRFSLALLGHFLLTSLNAQPGGPPTFYFNSPTTVATINQYTAYQLMTIGGVGSKIYEIESGTIPSGMTLSSDGVLFGTPTQIGVFTFFVSATDRANVKIRSSVRVEVNGTRFEFVQTALPAAVLGVGYNAPLSLSGSAPPVSLRISFGNLPPGLVLSSDGISGTPSLRGTYVFTVSANHLASGMAERQFLIHVTPSPTDVGNLLAIPTNPLPNGQLSVPYGASLTATGGSQPYRFQQISGQLPAGLSLQSNGSISGFPLQLGVLSFGVELRDAAGSVITANFSIEVTASTVFDFTNQSLPPGSSNVPYSSLVEASGGAQPYRFSLSLGTLPAGLSLSSTGRITGSPVGSGQASFTVRATDSSNRFIERSYNLTISPASSQNPPIFLTTTLPTAFLGIPYSTNIVASSNNPPITYRILNGIIPPPALSFSSSGALTGTPILPGFAIFVVQATDAAGNSVQQTFRIEVRDQADAEPLILPLATLNQPYSIQLDASGPAAPYTFAFEGGQLPVLMELSASGRLYGQPRFSGAFEFRVRVTDARGTSVVRRYRLNVQPTLLTVSLSALPEAIVRTPYSATLRVNGGNPPYAYRLIQGELPGGFSFDAPTGRISGTTTVVGSFPLSFRIRDTAGLEGDASLTLVVRPVTLSFNSTQLPDARVNEDYSFSFSGSGGTSPYTFQLAGGSLPPGLQLSTLGLLSGKPAQAGTFPLTLRLTDATAATAQVNLTLNVRAALPSISSTSLPDGALNVPYVAAVEARSPGALALSYRLSGGALPAGLTISTDGRIAGTPTSTGTFTFSIQVSDTQGGTAQRELTIRILSTTGPLRISSTGPPSGKLYYPYNFRLTAEGGFPPYLWNLTAGTPPSGLRLDSSTGSITGVPLAYGFYTFRLRLTDSRGNSTDLPPYTIPVFEAIRLTNGQLGQPYSAQLTQISGQTPITFSVEPGAIGGLPLGLTMSPNGSISGTPTSTGDFTFGVAARGSDGFVSQNSVTIQVLPLSASFPLVQSLPGATIGSNYKQNLRISGQQTSSRLTITSGALPPGISLDSANAMLSGSPFSVGDFFFTLTESLGERESASYRISIVPPGSPALAAVTNAASYERNALAPGQLLTIFGTNMGPPILRQFTLNNNLLPKELALTRVLFDGVASPMIYTSDGQLSAIAPFDLLGRVQTNMTVEYNGMLSAPLTIPVANSQPAIFTSDGSGKGQAAIVNEDGTLNGPLNPAPRGSVIVFYATGAGRMSPAGVDGRVAQAVSSLFQTVFVQIGSQRAELLYAGNAPGIVEGVIQVNTKIPQGLTEGLNEVRLGVGGNLSPVGVSLWVR